MDRQGYNNKANQQNPNNERYHNVRDDSAQKANNDNHANQKNPNNERYGK